jgi:hypothetical protein
MVIVITLIRWAGISVLLIVGGTGICLLMVRAALSQRLFNHMYRRDLSVRSRLHMKPLNASVSRRGFRLGFSLAGLWGFAAICVGTGIFITHII